MTGIFSRYKKGPIGDLKIGTRNISLNGSNFEVVSRNNDKTILKCISVDPRGTFSATGQVPKYKREDEVTLENNTEVMNDPNWLI